LDRELNVTYKDVMTQLKTRSLRNRLVESQRAWIWRRDNDCGLAGGGADANDPAASSIAYDTCRIDAVVRRIEWLRKVPENPDYLRKV
ncbi:MAG: lysozyme inhibitor LprI family protein, partial [Hyphomonas sp.]|jgi:uncharacterized protein YecT (DUF1311 family)|nr:lysozyme inhibitor LprI family protein [Hyphomonas sp.]